MGGKSRAELEQRRDLSLHGDPALLRKGESANQTQQCALPRPISSDDRHSLALLDLEGDILDGVEILLGATAKPILKVMPDKPLSRMAVKNFFEAFQSESFQPRLS